MDGRQLNCNDKRREGYWDEIWRLHRISNKLSKAKIAYKRSLDELDRMKSIVVNDSDRGVSGNNDTLPQRQLVVEKQTTKRKYPSSVHKYQWKKHRLVWTNDDIPK
ncbi:Hypothetical protein CINCED_3A020055 [Cinara cedri]|uniref:Uncharacterized protein n=1 Tax=Cinara cedri TaxID=506608 RepID=A0A5E4M9M1_9HEMI|nr:Hypothetical protein CINCED_3A020055 [Cinara cedri]